MIEDDRQLAEGLATAFRRSDYAVDWLPDGRQADSVLRTDEFDLVVLDLNLPDMDGLALLRRLRARRALTPVLVITARTGVEERVEGLDVGADDYLTKPFELAELEARIRALLRRSQGRATGLMKCGALEFDANARRATLQGRPLDLPRRELCLLEILVASAGQVVGKDQIASKLFSYDDDAGPNAIEIYVSRLRKKLATAGIEIRTIRGLGYLLQS